jgi:hypothetical protein
MTRFVRSSSPAVALVLLAVAPACAPAPVEPARLVETHGAAAYADDAASLPHIRFGDAGSSINDRCPVRKNKLNLKMPPLWVNGRPVGFC